MSFQFNLNNNNNANGTTGAASPFGSTSTPSKPGESQKPVFGGFGQNAAQPAQNAGSLFGKPAQGTASASGTVAPSSQPFGSLGAKPASFGLSASSAAPSGQNASSPFNFSKPVDSTKEQNQTSAFSFNGAASGQSNTPMFGGSNAGNTASPFGLGATKPEDSSQKSTIGFGSSETKNGSNPAFSFGASNNANSNTIDNGNKGGPKPFSFGGTASNDASKPSFSFGNATNNSAPKPAFGSLSNTSQPSTSNGSNTEAKAVPSFGSIAENKNEQKPSISFGDSLGNKGDSKPASTFSFGAMGKNDAAKPSAMGLNPPAAEVKNDNKPAFNINTSNVDKKEEAKPAFTFGGGAAKQDDNKSGSLFTSTQQNDAKAVPSFSLPTEKKDTSSPLFGQKADGETVKKPVATQDEKESSKPAFSFGSKTAASNPTTKGFSFGSATTSNADSKPADTKQAFTFGGSSDPKKEEKPSGNLTFGKKHSADDKPEENSFKVNFAAGATANEKSSVGGFSLGQAKSGDTSSKPGAFSFGSNNANKETPVSSGLKLGDKKVSEPSTSKPGGFSFGASKETEKKEGKLNETTPSATTLDSQKSVNIQPVSLDNKTLDDLVTKWTSQLGGSADHFKTYAQKVKEWDQILMVGGEHIGQLYSEMLMAEQTQSRVDQSLQYIERQQSELETFLDNYEKKAESLLSGVFSSSSGSSGNVNDQKRQQAYQTAEILDDNITSLSMNLSSLITEINGVSDTFNRATNLSVTNEDENTQLIKLLNSHLDALKSLDNSSELVEHKIRSL
ncbi:LANO_0H09494g1_1 [Lachancea nothofagi CBS 11611]|uniref:Nucleoporin NSP1 n=1 Tax=Lachancea nothofagi CBS 11611 TaxID=1266666 RepID=A0A1G4KLW1_9SACH|nr:LANO_0H09494g1_1 [Lachancea nothofagi CBS 11611]